MAQIEASADFRADWIVLTSKRRVLLILWEYSSVDLKGWNDGHMLQQPGV